MKLAGACVARTSGVRRPEMVAVSTSAQGHFRTSAGAAAMSALLRRADVASAVGHVRLVPKADLLMTIDSSTPHTRS